MLNIYLKIIYQMYTNADKVLFTCVIYLLSNTQQLYKKTSTRLISQLIWRKTNQNSAFKR